MPGFEPRTSYMGSDCSTTEQQPLLICRNYYLVGNY